VNARIQRRYDGLRVSPRGSRESETLATVSRGRGGELPGCLATSLKEVDCITHLSMDVQSLAIFLKEAALRAGCLTGLE
jgi:hypothetical protein